MMMMHKIKSDRKQTKIFNYSLSTKKMNMQLKYPPARRMKKTSGKTRSERKREGTKHFQARAQMAKPTVVVVIVVCFICFVSFPRCPRGVLREGSPRKCPAQRGRPLAFPEPQELFRWLEQSPSTPPPRFPARMSSWERRVRNTPGRRDRLNVRAIVP